MEEDAIEAPYPYPHLSSFLRTRRLQGGRWMDRWMTSACCSMNTRSLEGLTIKMDNGLCAEIGTARLFIVMFADEGNRTAWMGFVGFAHLGVASKAIERIVE